MCTFRFQPITADSSSFASVQTRPAPTTWRRTNQRTNQPDEKPARIRRRHNALHFRSSSWFICGTCKTQIASTCWFLVWVLRPPVVVENGLKQQQLWQTGTTTYFDTVTSFCQSPSYGGGCGSRPFICPNNGYYEIPGTSCTSSYYYKLHQRHCLRTGNHHISIINQNITWNIVVCHYSIDSNVLFFECRLALVDLFITQDTSVTRPLTILAAPTACQAFRSPIWKAIFK